MLLFRNILLNLGDPRSAVLSRHSSARHVKSGGETSPTWIVYDYYHYRSSHSPLQSHSSSTDALSWLSLTLLTHSYYPFDPLQDYVLVHKWPLLQPTLQSRRCDHTLVPVASVCRQNSTRVRGVWFTSICSVALICLPLDLSRIRILSEDSYLYFSIFSAVIYYYRFDLQRRNYCYAIFIIYVEKLFISFMRCVIVLTVNFASIMMHTHCNSINSILYSSLYIKCVIHIQEFI